MRKCIVSVIVLSVLLLFFLASASAVVTTETGTLPDSATYLMEVPSP